MKKSFRLLGSFALLGIISAIFFSGCTTKCTQTRTYLKSIPIKVSLSDMRKSISITTKAGIDKPGKIHVSGDWLFIVDNGTGIHVIDNHDPENPQFKSFISMLGCLDVASNGEQLYADQGPDVVVFDIQDKSNIKFSFRLVNTINRMLIEDDSVIVDYKKEEVVEILEDADCSQSNRWFMGEDVVFSPTMNSGGASGSMARMLVKDGKLYVADSRQVHVFKIQGNSLSKTQEQDFGNGIETMFATPENIFLGTNDGMMILDIVSSGVQFRSFFSHARGCDPVVVKDDIAFVTLRGNSVCGFAQNVLDVVDVKNLSQPILLHEFFFNDPHGLGVNANTLALCDGASGLKFFDMANLAELQSNLLATKSGVKAFDVILLGDHCILSAEEGIFQFDISNRSNPVQISVLYQAK